MVRDQLLFLSGRGWGRLEDFLGYYTALYGNGGGGGGGSSNEKGDYRELTASEWGINRMLRSLIGGSGRFYHDSNKILSPPPPPQAINNKRSLTGP